MTVVLPTHNRPEFLVEAIDSVCSQTVADWELVVVDSGSAPPARIPDHPCIRLVRLDHNEGPAKARNVGLEHARGRSVAFLDDDDVFTPERLEIGLAGLARAPVAVCVARFLDVPARRPRQLEGDVSDVILDGLTPSLGATMIRRDACAPFDERWSAVEDVEWWWRTAQRHAVTTVDEVGYLVRRHGGARVRNDRASRIVQNLAFMDSQPEWFATHRRAKAMRLQRAGFLAAEFENRPMARRLLARSLRVRPTVRGVWHFARLGRPRVMVGRS